MSGEFPETSAEAVGEVFTREKKKKKASKCVQKVIGGCRKGHFSVSTVGVVDEHIHSGLGVFKAISFWFA